VHTPTHCTEMEVVNNSAELTSKHVKTVLSLIDREGVHTLSALVYIGGGELGCILNMSILICNTYL